MLFNNVKKKCLILLAGSLDYFWGAEDGLPVEIFLISQF